MERLKDIIVELREKQAESNLSYSQMMKLMEDNGDYISKSTLSRIFGDSWEDYTYNYETTIRPLAKVLLGIETIEDSDNLDTKAMKSLLKYKIERIEELEKALAEAKVKYNEKLEVERERHAKSIDFLKEQVAYKDKRMDMLLEAVFEKDKMHREMLEKVLKCSKCPLGDNNEG